MIQVLNSSWCMQNRKYINKQQHQLAILSNKQQQAAVDRSDSLLCAAISLDVLVLRTPASTAKQESIKQASIHQAHSKHTSDITRCSGKLPCDGGAEDSRRRGDSGRWARRRHHIVHTFSSTAWFEGLHISVKITLTSELCSH